jgi:hypothetical protein
MKRILCLLLVATLPFGSALNREMVLEAAHAAAV